MLGTPETGSGKQIRISAEDQALCRKDLDRVMSAITAPKPPRDFHPDDCRKMLEKAREEAENATAPLEASLAQRDTKWSPPPHR